MSPWVGILEKLPHRRLQTRQAGRHLQAAHALRPLLSGQPPTSKSSWQLKRNFHILQNPNWELLGEGEGLEVQPRLDPTLHQLS